MNKIYKVYNKKNMFPNQPNVSHNERLEGGNQQHAEIHCHEYVLLFLI